MSTQKKTTVRPDLKITKRNVASFLRKAAKLVDGGWTTGNYRVVKNGKTAYCAVGAFRALSGKTASGFAMQTAASKALIECGVPSFGDSPTDAVVGWNDSQKNPNVVSAKMRLTAYRLDHGLKVNLTGTS